MLGLGGCFHSSHLTTAAVTSHAPIAMRACTHPYRACTPFMRRPTNPSNSPPASQPCTSSPVRPGSEGVRADAQVQLPQRLAPVEHRQSGHVPPGEAAYLSARRERSVHYKIAAGKRRSMGGGVSYRKCRAVVMLTGNTQQQHNGASPRQRAGRRPNGFLAS